MTAIIARTAVFIVANHVKIWRQVGVSSVSVLTYDRVIGIARGQVPTRPIRLSPAIVVIKGFDWPLDEVVAVVVGVGGCVAGIAELHLQAGINDGASLED